jgi:hypothetical protein
MSMAGSVIDDEFVEMAPLPEVTVAGITWQRQQEGSLSPGLTILIFFSGQAQCCKKATTLLSGKCTPVA